MSKNILRAAYKKLQARLERYGLLHAQADALHDAFLRLWTDSYHPAGEKEGERLLYQSMRRRLISLWRAANRHPQIPAAHVQIADSPPPDTEADDTSKEIWELIRTQLTPLQQDILTRHDINDETYSEIAERLGMQEAAVRMQLSRARKKIRAIYKQKRK